MLELQDLSLVGKTQLVVVVELSEVDMHFEEQKVLNMVEESTHVEYEVKVIVDTEEWCTENDSDCSETIMDDSWQLRQVGLEIFHPLSEPH
ncbi:hypothetical protein Tco_0109829 [Tanacetum coccineum]